jgi:hypothetical protein
VIVIVAAVPDAGCTVTVAARAISTMLASAVKGTICVPVPLVVESPNHTAELLAVHVQVGSVNITLMPPVAAPDGNEVGPKSVAVQAPG